ncbi:NAD(P)H-hydrate dehydratase [bacterium]
MNKLTISKNSVKKYLETKKRKNNTCKYDYGHVLVIAGCRGMLGAAVLSAKASLRSGAGLVTCAVPEGICDSAMSHFVEIMTLPAHTNAKYYFDKKSCESILNFIEKRKIDSVIIGPGLGRETETIEFTREIVKNIKIPLIIDADALYALSFMNNEFQINALSNIKNVVITPHAKELSRMIGKDSEFVEKNKELCCKEIAKQNNIMCVLKGFNTLITGGEKTFVNTTGNPGMAAAGSGDVLSGMLAGFLAQDKKMDIKTIASCVYLHGAAGDLARDNFGENGLIASDIIDFIPKAILDCVK